MATGCKGVPGAPKVPTAPGGVPTSVPPGLPGGGDSEVDPNTCGNYAVNDAGRKLKAFLTATKTLQVTAENTIKVVRESCAIMGKELGMPDADLAGDTKEVCAKVWGVIDGNMKGVAVKSKAALKIKIVPAVCKVDIQATAKAAAECEGSASADVGATCSGKCSGKCSGGCDGKMGTGGNAGQCEGQCKGTCEGSCEGHADVKASAQCKASAEVKGSAEVTCTEPSVTVEWDAKLIVDKGKAEMTLKALKNGLPKILAVKARLVPLAVATKVWAGAAAGLAAEGPQLAKSFKDQFMCISGQIAAVAKASMAIQANVSVSVEVSASASGSVGGG